MDRGRTSKHKCRMNVGTPWPCTDCSTLVQWKLALCAHSSCSAAGATASRSRMPVPPSRHFQSREFPGRARRAPIGVVRHRRPLARWRRLNHAAPGGASPEAVCRASCFVIPNALVPARYRARAWVEWAGEAAPLGGGGRRQGSAWPCSAMPPPDAAHAPLLTWTSFPPRPPCRPAYLEQPRGEWKPS